MMMKRLLFLMLAAVGAASCDAGSGNPVTAAIAQADGRDHRFAELPKQLPGEAVATFASGCYWCTEHVFESLKGVRTVISGHSGGTAVSPTYEQVYRGGTGHAEAVQVYYDPKVISFPTLLRVFFVQHDPTTLNRQGPDSGDEYRSVAFYRTPQEKQQIEAEIKRVTAAKRYANPIVTEVTAFKVFYPAERYHQDYFKNNPNDPYVRNVSTPRFNKFAKEFPQLIKPEA
ncbi:peptide-methionine (S)-S-oxide reductase MsrA [Hymenobacter koreensis]|uniref:Peptide methionine sulfoxide reductase MsrA n=1 Tax=Hymenobacter koreensis TaxID=1084523 RepID=A0ABP8JNM4_9BACT